MELEIIPVLMKSCFINLIAEACIYGFISKKCQDNLQYLVYPNKVNVNTLLKQLVTVLALILLFDI